MTIYFKSQFQFYHTILYKKKAYTKLKFSVVTTFCLEIFIILIMFSQFCGQF